MTHRFVAPLFALLLLSGPALAQQPIRWGYSLASPTGELLGSQSGITDWQTNFALLPAPVLRPGPATRDDPSWFPDVHVKSATSTATLTLKDEVSDFSQSFDLYWTMNESWKLLTLPDGSTSAEVQDAWSESGPRDTSAGRQVGRLRFQIEQVDGNTILSVEQTLNVPEPATLVLGGIGMVGVIGLRMRKRSR